MSASAIMASSSSAYDSLYTKETLHLLQEGEIQVLRCDFPFVRRHNFVGCRDDTVPIKVLNPRRGFSTRALK